MTKEDWDNTPHRKLNALFDKARMICSTCGTEMRFMGEWPMSYPKPGEMPAPMNLHQVVRWHCTTCRVHIPGESRPLPVFVALILDDHLIEAARKL